MVRVCSSGFGWYCSIFLVCIVHKILIVSRILSIDLTPGAYDYGYYELIFLPNNCLPSRNIFLFSVSRFCAFSLSRVRV